MRKTTRRQVWAQLPPRGMRPRLARDQLTDLALAHLTNLDVMVKGEADESLMWQLAEQALLWSQVAGIEVMDQLAELVDKHHALAAALWAEQALQDLRAPVEAARGLAQNVRANRPTRAAQE